MAIRMQIDIGMHKEPKSARAGKLALHAILTESAATLQSKVAAMETEVAVAESRCNGSGGGHE